MEHHKRLELCTTRPKYRDGRRLTAIKTYTIASESAYILILGIPQVGVQEELLKLCRLYGTLSSHKLLPAYPSEPFTQTMLVKYERIQSARVAKRKLDDYSFYGGTLHVCYAPENETVVETRAKLKGRINEVCRQKHRLATEAAQGEAQRQVVCSSVINVTNQEPAVIRTIPHSQPADHCRTEAKNRTKPDVPQPETRTDRRSGKGACNTAPAETKHIDGELVKPYNYVKTRMVPRTVNRNMTERNELREQIRETVNEQLKRNALKLGPVAGPRVMPRKSPLEEAFRDTLTGSSHMDKTLEGIRNRLKRVSENNHTSVSKRKKPDG